MTPRLTIVKPSFETPASKLGWFPKARTPRPSTLISTLISMWEHSFMPVPIGLDPVNSHYMREDYTTAHHSIYTRQSHGTTPFDATTPKELTKKPHLTPLSHPRAIPKQSLLKAWALCGRTVEATSRSAVPRGQIGQWNPRSTSQRDNRSPHRHCYISMERPR